MSDNVEPKRRTGEQSKALAEAAAVVVAARREAAAILRRADTELLPEEREWLVGDGCGGALAPPPTPHFCRCPRYRGNGQEPCVNTFVDDTGPDFGTGSPRVRCRHPKDAHGRI